MKQRARKRHLVKLMAAAVVRHKLARLQREFVDAFLRRLNERSDASRALVEALKATILRAVVRPIVAQVVAAMTQRNAA